MTRFQLSDPITTLTKRQLAERLNVVPGTIMRWVKAGRFPAPIRLTEQTLVWRAAVVEAWLIERERATTQEHANA